MALLACGTSWHAGLVGKFLLEQVAGIPAEVDYGSEFRYRTPIVGPETLAVAISQSGETADTLAAFREAKRRGALPIGICNVQGSMLTREAAGSLLTHAGPEIGVASTKAFTAQLTALALLALHLGRLRGTLSADACRHHLEGLTRIPQLMEQTLAAQGAVEELSRSLMQARDFWMPLMIVALLFFVIIPTFLLLILGSVKDANLAKKLSDVVGSLPKDLQANVDGKKGAVGASYALAVYLFAPLAITSAGPRF